MSTIVMKLGKADVKKIMPPKCTKGANDNKTNQMERSFLSRDYDGGLSRNNAKISHSHNAINQTLKKGAIALKPFKNSQANHGRYAASI